MLKYWLIDLLDYVLYNIILLTIAFFFNRFYQMLIFLVCYEVIQNCFRYRFHADTIQTNPRKAVVLCKLITVGVEFTYLLVSLSVEISIYLNIFIIFITAFINTVLEFCIETVRDKYKILKDNDLLIAACNIHNLTKEAYTRLKLKYIDNLTYAEIAERECVDVDTIRKSINRSKHKLFKD